jgi:hypothetical protein
LRGEGEGEKKKIEKLKIEIEIEKLKIKNERKRKKKEKIIALIRYRQEGCHSCFLLSFYGSLAAVWFPFCCIRTGAEEKKWKVETWFSYIRRPYLTLPTPFMSLPWSRHRDLASIWVSLC